MSPQRRSHHLPAAALFAALSFAPPLHAQGCAQCQDNTAATPPKTQAAYRHAIESGYRFYSFGDAMLLEPAIAARPDPS